MALEQSAFRLGTSGWSHRNWAGNFYPYDMPPGEYLTAYAQQFLTVEVEYTSFSIPSKPMVQSWYRRTPAGFCFSPSLPRSITHDQRLRSVQPLLEEFLAAITELGNKLGPILIQLPEDFRTMEQEALEAFLEILPRHRQFALEFRHGSWIKESTFRLLEQHQVGWVVVDAPFLPRIARVTAPFAYVRWHGRPGYQNRRQLDPIGALRSWIPLLRELGQQALQVYGYVNNRFSGYAPRDCEVLQNLLGEGRQG